MKFTSNVVNKIGLVLTVLAVILCFGIFTMSNAGYATYAKAANSTAPTNFRGATVKIEEYTPTYTITKVTDYEVTDSEGGSTSVKGVLLPKITSADGELKVTAKSAAGKTVQVSKCSDGRYILVPDLYVGTYNITAVATLNGVKTTKKFTISFDSVSVAFEDITSTNTQYIIPEYVNPGTKLTFGYPNVILDGDTDNTISSASAEYGTLTVSVVDPNGDSVDLTATDGVFTYTVPTENANGSYKVKYSYNYTNTNQTIARSYTFNVVDSSQFDTSKDVTLKISEWSSALDDITMSVGVEKTLPTPTVINSQNNSTISTYNTISVEYYNTETKAWESVSSDAITDYKFTPTKVGDYRFTYTCTDFYGNTTTRISANIKATLSSSTLGLKLTNKSYDPNADNFNKEALYKDTTSVDYMVPTKIAKGSSFTIPAMIASSYGDYELNYTFTIAGASKPYYEIQEYKFENTGTYTINYQVAYAENTNQRVQKTFQVQVVESLDADDVTLEGEISGLSTSVNAGSDLNFTVSATDTLNSDGTTVDTNIQKTVTAKIGDNDATVTTNDNGSYTLNVPAKAVNGAQVTITVVLKDDLGNTNSLTKTITVVDYSSDHEAPTLNIDDVPADATDEGKASYNFVRGSSVSVFPITATDADSNFAVDVEVKNGGNTVLRKSAFSNKSTSGYTAKITGTQFAFTLSNSGLYTITYTATDSNNNQTIFSYQVWSESNSTPGITLTGVQTSANTGETIDLSDIAKVSRDGEYLDYDTVLITDENVDSTKIKQYIIDNSISPNSVIVLVKGEFAKGNTDTSIIALGDINLTVWAYGDNTDEAKCIDVNAYKTATITVSDTTKPQFTISGQGNSDRNIALTNGTANITVDWFATVDDKALGYEGSGVKTLTITATYEGNSDEEWSISKSPDDDITDADLTFDVTKNGRLNVVYTVADYANNESTVTLYYYVGDCVAPVVSLGDQDLTATLKTGSDFVIDLEKITATDDGETYKYGDSDITFKIVLTKDGSDISSSATTSNNEWKVSSLEAGSYVLTVTATDSAGNVSYAQSKTFTVESEGSTKVTSTTVWGTILIILALILLSGVIFFFVRPTKGKIKIDNRKAEKTTTESVETKAEDKNEK